MADTRQELIWLRDDAVNGSASAHARMVHEQAIYNNKGQYDTDKTVGRMYTVAGESLNPKTTEAIQKIKPAYEDAMPRIEFQPDRSTRTDEDIVLVQDLQNWHDMMDDADGEGEIRKTLIHHNSVVGHALSKVLYNPRTGVVNAPSIDPTTFAPDPKCTDIEFKTAEYVDHFNERDGRHVRRYYPDYWEGLDKKEVRGTGYRVDEMWLRRELAEDIGVDLSSTKKAIVKATLINDDIAHVRPSPFWWPDFPFAGWRNMIDYTADGKSQSYWGFGFASLLWPQQKMLDHLLANLVLIVNNQAVGRFLSEKGALDWEQILPIHGLNIELEEGIKLNQIEFLPPDQIPPILIDFVKYITEIMTNMVPSLSPVFTGEAPFSGASGRAVSALQFAAFSQASTNIKSANEFRKRRARMKAVMIQQFAKKPLAPHMWRGGLDLPDRFPEDARHIGFNIHTADATSLPNTPVGRLQIAQFLAAQGLQMTPQKLLEFVGLDQGFGIRAEDFIMNPLGGAGAPINEEVITGRETAIEEATL